MDEENRLSTEGEVSQQPEGPQGMFRNPFSFNGRIRRKEYAISILLYFIYYYLIGLFFNPMLQEAGREGGIAARIIAIFYLLVLIPGLWFIWAQGAKRCHDRDNSGWYQLIPFYNLWMLFADGDPYKNRYGSDPKGRNEYEYSE